MNSYLLSFLAILCLGPWTTARGVYESLRKNSVEVTEETTKKISADAAGLPLINGLIRVASQARTWAQWVRRLLKALRKWYNTHPPEVKLGKCFGSYFRIKIPGLRQDGKFVGYNENPKSNEHPPKKIKIKREVVAFCHNQRKNFKEYSLFLPWHFYTEIRDRFIKYRDVMLRDEFIVCLLDYFWKKFWSWVDSAPDAPRRAAN